MHVVVMPGPPARLSQRRGTLQQQVVTTSQYGDFVLTDEVTGQLNALPASGVDLSALVGQRVTVPGFENGKVEGALPLLDVIRVRPL
jgi:hypothetical protein